MPVYGNQKQHEPRYSRILTDITRTWVEGNPLPCRRVGERGAKVQTGKQKYSLAAQKQEDVGVCWKKCMRGDLLFVPMRQAKGSHGKITTQKREPQEGHHTEATSDHRTDTNKRPCPHELSPHKHA